MSYTYLQGEVAESSEAYCWDTDPCALLNMTLMPEKSCLLDKEIKASPDSLSGMMSQRLKVQSGGAKSTSYVVASHAKTSLPQAKGQDWKGIEAGYGGRWHELYMKYNHDTSSLRTHLCLWEEDLPVFSVILPRWGMMQNGVFWELTTLEGITFANVAGFWPTPLKEEGPGGQQMKLTDAVAVAEGFKPRYYKMDGMDGKKVFTGKVNPEWTEWLMGWPMGWTNVLQELEMDRFQLWQQQHGAYYANKQEI